MYVGFLKIPFFSFSVKKMKFKSFQTVYYESNQSAQTSLKEERICPRNERRRTAKNEIYFVI